MTQQHPIAPPPELVQQWTTSLDCPESWGPKNQWIADKAAQWGADQELEACCEWLDREGWSGESRQLRAARRPSPPSLKKQALALLDKAEDPSWDINDFSIVRQALEQLND